MRIRIPRALAEKVGLLESSSVEIKIENNHILIQKPTYQLDALVAQVTLGNQHHEIKSSAPRGKEIW